ncbi:hypothetical protein ING2E5A_1643 [Petrimonas mucosa]|jgi:hypothetical protein|uniref:Uncharacterized protein n=1 Tax=Petrimonas mucosa TaxID=1642646 RepID=A0A1G4G7I2_9BACT|nr:hypothetical protein ING2E5A_1643 [Petrimonas mucosa]SFU69086.1 hypothetical protein SAMN05216364_10689 [Porphyromonadaceae bacterium KHP3R9]
MNKISIFQKNDLSLHSDFGSGYRICKNNGKRGRWFFEIVYIAEIAQLVEHNLAPEV